MKLVWWWSWRGASGVASGVAAGDAAGAGLFFSADFSGTALKMGSLGGISSTRVVSAPSASGSISSSSCSSSSSARIKQKTCHDKKSTGNINSSVLIFKMLVLE